MVLERPDVNFLTISSELLTVHFRALTGRPAVLQWIGSPLRSVKSCRRSRACGVRPEGQSPTTEREGEAMRFVIRNALRSTLLAFLVTGIAAASASASTSPIVGHVYVNDNTAGANTVAGFDRHANGTLTAVPGSPFQAGGAGTGPTSPPRARFNPRSAATTCWRSTPPATRSRSLRPATTEAWRRYPSPPRGVRPGQHRRPRPTGVRRQRVRGGAQLHRLPPRV